MFRSSSPWQSAAGIARLHPMDTIKPVPDGCAETPGAETGAERQRRMAWEAEMITEADADIAAGRVVDSAKVRAWIDSIGTEHELPLPRTRRR
jgi:hypothetical protein